MTVTHIKVEYPTHERVVVKTEAEMRSLGYKNYKGDKTKSVFYNRLQSITVKQLSRRVQEEFMTDADYEAELEAMCVAQTGMTPADYQTRHGMAWNE